MSDYLESAILNHVLRNTSFTSPSVVYIGLSTASMNDDASGTELSGSGYARQTIAFNAPSSGACTNSADVDFPVATGTWGAITHYSIWDAASSGNMLAHGALTTSKTVTSGDILRIGTGQVTITAA